MQGEKKMNFFISFEFPKTSVEKGYFVHRKKELHSFKTLKEYKSFHHSRYFQLNVSTSRCKCSTPALCSYSHKKKDLQIK